MDAESRSRPRELTIPALDGPGLAARLWPVDAPRGVVIVAHGLGEHGGAYAHVAAAIGEAIAVDVLAIDFRGHGRSPGRRGVVARYEDLCDDLRSAVAWSEAERPGLTLFAIGHSNGGQVVLRALLDGGLDVAGVILSNPALRVATPIPRWKLALGRCLRRFAPGITIATRLEPETLTSDRALLDERLVDPLRHDRVSAPLFFGMVEGGEAILARAAEITTPLLLILGDADPVIDPDFTLAAFEAFASTDKSAVIFPGMLHEPFNEVGRDRVIAAAIGWIAARLPVA